MDPQQSLHRRKSSKDSEPNLLILPPDDSINGSGGHALPPSPRSRVHSTPAGHGRSFSTTSTFGPPPTSPFNASFGRHPTGLQPPTSPTSPYFQLAPAPPGRGHSRIRSISAFAPPSPSPLSSSFPASASANDALVSNTPITHTFPTSLSHPEPLTSPINPSAPSQHTRRHTRLHSRNLSVFFPRPGSLPHSAIAEDGMQDAEQAPVSNVPSAGPNVNWRSGRRAASLQQHQQPTTPFGAGFTFGGRPRRTDDSAGSSDPSTGIGGSGSLPMAPPMAPSLSSSSSTSSVSSRRGHHHKHSLSHNFFSFLEPGADLGVGADGELHTLPTPVPVSPWMTGQTTPLPADEDRQGDISPSSLSSPEEGSISKVPNSFSAERDDSAAGGGGGGGGRAVADGANVVGAVQFMIGAWLWVVGQQVGSLACTGLGYWVVFDAIGVGIGRVVPRWLKSTSGKQGEKGMVRRPYGNARLETVLMFAQAVYLMFSAVYVCKETVEHVLLSAGPGGGEKHHHHHHASDDDGTHGIQFPLFLLFITFFSLLSTAFLYENHTKLVNVTNSRIPSFGALIRSLLTTTQRTYQEPPPATPTGLVLSNPYVASPLLFCLAILFVALCIPPSQHEATDLVLAAVIAVITFNVAYRACSVLGTVLLQTAPPRGLPGGKMESFLRAMKDLQRHPQVLHLPPPHIWQLAVPGVASGGGGGGAHEKRDFQGDEGGGGGGGKNGSVETLIVTIELRVRSDLGDEDVLKLTRWAWEKSMFALGASANWEDKGRGEGPEVTVGVVRG